MHTRLGRNRQRGIVMPLIVIALAAMFGMAGLGMEVGQVYLAKTRLQNALDAAALSAAKTLKVNDGNTQEATADALETFNFYAGELDLVDAAPTVEFSPTLQPFAAGGAPPRYVRLRMGGIDVPLRLSLAIPGVPESIDVGGSAVAGPMELGANPGDEVCDIVPLVVSVDPDADTDCSDGSCYGYSEGEIVDLKVGSDSQGNGGGQGNNNEEDGAETSGPGNFNLMRLGCGSGAACVRGGLAGEFSGCVTVGGTTNTEPGNTVGPTAQGINTRFGVYQGGGLSSADYPPDAVTAEGLTFDQYLARLEGGQFDNPPPQGVPRRRVVSVIFSDFSDQSGGVNTLTVDGLGCFFLVERVSQGGNQTVRGEFTTDCNPEGPNNPLPAGSNGFFRIVLYDDPDSRDS